MKYKQICCAIMVGGLAAQNSFGGPPEPGPQQPPAPPTLTDVAAKAIKATYTDAILGDSKITMDRGIQVYNVAVTGDKNVTTVEVCAATTNFSTEGLVMQGDRKIDPKDIPAAVAAAASTAASLAPLDFVITVGVPPPPTISSVDKLDLRSDITPHTYKSDGKYKLVTLDTPVIAYDIFFVKADGTKGLVRVAADGTILSPMNWMKRASADVPAGKLVIRLNFGCIQDYTDYSGILWSKDRVYSAANGFGALGGRPNNRVGLIIPGTDAPFIYDSERDKEGAARFDVPNGAYTVRIHMCETWEKARQPNIREFGIKIQGQKLVDKMDIAGTAGGWMIPLVKEFKDIQVTDGKLLVEPFSNNKRDQHPSIEAYEVYAQ